MTKDAPDKTASHWVQTGFQAQAEGDWLRAEEAYRQALQLQPAHPAALQLMGMVALHRNELADAEDLMRRSLAVEERQPHVWNNLGNLLERDGRSAKAEGCFDRALALAPDYADAHYNRARALYSQERLEESYRALNTVLRLSSTPPVGVLQLLAQVQSDSGSVDTAIGTLEHALKLAPDKPALLHNLATLLHKSHRYPEALQLHERALSLGLDAADAHYNLGNTLQSLGRLDDAVCAYRAALKRHPSHRLALFDLSRLRWRMGDSDFDAELQIAAEADSTSAIALALLANLLLHAERHAGAADAFRRALQRAPTNPLMQDGLARCMVRMGSVEEGLQWHQRAIELAPLDPVLHTSYARSLLIAGLAAKAAATAEVACGLAPDDQNALALLGLAWRLLGNPKERWLNDERRLVRVDDLPVPLGFVDMASFNEALARELRVLHVDRVAPVDQTLRGGTQSMGDLFSQGHQLVNVLKARIGEAVSRYIASLPPDAEHPFLRRRVRHWRYSTAWSSRLCSGGFHTNHVHPQGWISAVYYVVVPPVSAGAELQEGWLQFGQPDFSIAAHDSMRFSVQPKAGRLVLFPSMFWHGTIPFADSTQRLTIAFDVLPQDNAPT